MATKFLRKIILEELQKVLKEDRWYDDPQFMGSTETPYTGVDDIPYTPDQTMGTSSPFFRGKSSVKPKPKVKSKAQLRREAVRRMQKELERLGYPGDLQKPGVFDDSTLEHLQMTFPGIDKTRTPDSISTDTINTFVSFLKKKPTGYADVTLANREEIPLPSGKKFSDIELQAQRGTTTPREPDSDSDGDLGTKYLKPETPEEKEKRRKAREEVKSMLGSGPLGQEPEQNLFKDQEPDNQQESIRREINKLLKML